MARTRQGTSGFAALAETGDAAHPGRALGSQIEDCRWQGGWETGDGWWGRPWGEDGAGRVCCFPINNLHTRCCPHSGHCRWCHPGEGAATNHGLCSGTSCPSMVWALFGFQTSGRCSHGACVGQGGARGAPRAAAALCQECRAGPWPALPRYCLSRRGHGGCGLVSVGTGRAGSSGRQPRPLARGRPCGSSPGAALGLSGRCLRRLAGQKVLLSPRCPPARGCRCPRRATGGHGTEERG